MYFRRVTEAPDCKAIAKQLPCGLCPVRDFRESASRRRRAEIAVKVTSALHAEKQSSWLKRNCEAIAVLVMSRPHISVKAFPPQGGAEIAVKVASVLHGCHQGW
jgi:hypothetical protein